MALPKWMLKKEPEKEPAKAAPAFTPVKVITGQSTVDYNAYFQKVMEDANLPGPDYLEFSNAVNKLNGQPLSEEQKYVITFSTFSAMNVDSNKLCSSADEYIKKLQEKKQRFIGDLQSERKVNVTDKQALIQATQKEMQDLTKAIQEKSLLVEKLNTEVNTDSNKLDIEENAFNNALINKEQEIRNNIVKIKTYIK